MNYCHTLKPAKKESKVTENFLDGFLSGAFLSKFDFFFLFEKITKNTSVLDVTSAYLHG